MKIREVGSGHSGAIPAKGPDEKGDKPRVDTGAFRDNLVKANYERHEERIAALMQEIEKQGERLTQSLNLKDLQAFKRSVRDFMDEAVEGMLKYSKDSVLDRRGRHRIYVIVKKINRNLEELTEKMRSDQRDRLDILKKVDSIKGLLVDLYT
ncbi:MAG: hypothetical protein HPY66_0404 [Firmicutes bacterium]|nr:hypothetical protein [Bacillota bacterium]MDI6705102.1 YaaR family protein [Bacillota bacterium]